MNNNYDLDGLSLSDFARKIDYLDIAKKQNQAAVKDTGFIYVLCTCVFFVTDYNVKLLFD